MKKLYVQMLVVLCILTTSASAVVPEYPPLPSGSIEIAYDNGVFFDSQGQSLFDDQQLRVRFTPLPETVGGLLKEARIAWSGPGWEGDFFVRIKDAVTGSYVDSPVQSNTPGNWQVVDVSALGFMIPNNDFYIELHQVLGSHDKAVYFADADSGRSEWSPLTGPWNPIGYNLGIRAVIQPIPVPTAGSISGFKINDTNGNGKWDASEKGISNWTIRLIGITGKGKNANVIRKETLTDATGFYKFDNLQASRYFVIEKLKKGFVPTSSPVKRIKIAQGTNSMNNNFTNKPVKSRDNKNDNGDIDDYEAINRDINKYKEDMNWD